MRAGGIGQATIVTYGEHEAIAIDAGAIQVVPAWCWPLERQRKGKLPRRA